MKCGACKYEHKAGVDSKGKWSDNLVGDKPFAKVVGAILETVEDYDVSKVYMYICPKCSSLIAGDSYGDNFYSLPIETSDDD